MSDVPLDRIPPEDRHVDMTSARDVEALLLEHWAGDPQPMEEIADAER